MASIINAQHVRLKKVYGFLAQPKFFISLTCSTLNCCVHSSKSFWFISMNSFSALYIRPWIV